MKKGPQDKPKILPVTAYIVIYPLIISLSTLIGAIAYAVNKSLAKNVIIFFILLGWIPSLFLFIKDQQKLFPYTKQNQEYKLLSRKRSILFWILYPFLILSIWNFIYTLFEFIENH